MTDMISIPRLEGEDEELTEQIQTDMEAKLEQIKAEIDRDRDSAAGLEERGKVEAGSSGGSGKGGSSALEDLDFDVETKIAPKKIEVDLSVLEAMD